MNVWKPFSEQPIEDLPLRIIDAYGYIFPATLRMHKGELQYRFEDYAPWEGLCRLGTQSVVKHYKWCYDSQYAPEPLRDNHPPIFPQEHFLKWVTIHRPQTYNELLREYHDFCKDNPEKANIL